MSLFQDINQESSAIVGFGVRVLLISTDGKDSPVATKLAGLGSVLEHCDELYSGIDTVLDDPNGYGLIVIDCDTLGGLSAGQRAHTLLRVTARCFPVILVSKECAQQQFPESRHAPTLLRSPLSSVSLRVGFEHALRERFALQIAG